MKFILILIAMLSMLSACNAPESNDTAASNAPTTTLPDTSNSDPSNPPPANGDETNSYTTDVLLFNGVGISTSDWQTTEQILKSNGFTYRLANSSQLNAMSLDQITSHGVMIFPGGYGNQISNGLTQATRLRLREAVRVHGVGYVGFCAGAWVAVDPEVDLDQVASYGFGIAEGAHLNLYHPNGSTPTADMVDVTFADGSHRDLVWWGGPYTSEWTNGVVARYKTGEPAISQTWAGKGFVVVSGPHPEAPQGWRNTAGSDSDGLDYDIAVDMIKAALNKQPLPAF